MEEKTENVTFDDFPLRMIIVSDTVAFGIYIIGALIMFRLGMIWGWIYIFACLVAEIRIMRMSCVHCYYYGKFCGLGKGKLAALFFSKGDPKKFLEKDIKWKDLIPDLLIALVPFFAGIFLLIAGFSWLLLLLLLALLALATAGNGFIRGSIVCKYCKQRKLGCPAERFFSGGKTEGNTLFS